jgi:hypothetical protein
MGFYNNGTVTVNTGSLYLGTWGTHFGSFNVTTTLSLNSISFNQTFTSSRYFSIPTILRLLSNVFGPGTVIFEGTGNYFMDAPFSAPTVKSQVSSNTYFNVAWQSTYLWVTGNATFNLLSGGNMNTLVVMGYGTLVTGNDLSVTNSFVGGGQLATIKSDVSLMDFVVLIYR